MSGPSNPLVDHGLGPGEDRPIEAVQAPREPVDERVELRIGQRTIHPSIELRGVRIEVVATKDGLERTGTSDQQRQTLEAASTGDDARADLDLREDRALTTREAHIERLRDLAAEPSCTTAYEADGHEGGLLQAPGDVRPWRQTRGSWLEPVLGDTHKINVRDEEVRMRAIEDHDLQVRLSLQLGDQRLERKHDLWSRHVDRRRVERDP